MNLTSAAALRTSGSPAFEPLERRTCLSSVVGGPEVLVASSAGPVGARHTASDANGDTVVVWRGEETVADRHNVYASILAPDGTVKKSSFLVDATSYTKREPTLAVAPNGSFVVSWEGYDSGAYVIRARRFDAQGGALGSEVTVFSSKSTQVFQPAVAMNDSTFVVAWRGPDPKGGKFSEIYAQRFTAAGTKVGGVFMANTDANVRHVEPSADMDRAGNFVIAWSNEVNGMGTGTGIYAQRFSASGAKLGGEFRVNLSTGSEWNSSEVAVGPDGEFAVVWQGNKATGGSGCFGQLYAADGTRVGGTFALAARPGGTEQYPSVDVGTGGNFVASWTDYNDGSRLAYAQLFGPGATPASDPVALGSSYSAEAVVQPDGGFEAVRRAGTTLRAQRFSFVTDPFVPIASDTSVFSSLSIAGRVTGADELLATL